VPLINIVRREEQVKTLEELGAENIINSSSDSFKTDLKAAVDKYGADCFYDAIGGEFTAEVLEAMPADSSAYIYGGLSGKAVTISPLNLIFYQKTISYLWLSPWFSTIDDETRKKAVGEIVEDLATGGKIFGVDVAKTIPLSEFENAFELANKHASEGKIILKPHES
jgi:NADPH:quinone reductase-like Zn-dependent oxidoreductase